MAAIVTRVEVDRPAEDVFVYATDPTRFHEWQQGVVSGHLEASGPPTVGTKCHTTRRIGGAERPSVSQVTHIDAPKTWGVRGIDGPIRASSRSPSNLYRAKTLPMVVTWQFVDWVRLPGGTR